MNKQLLNTIHKYAEDREIDYIAAKVIAEQHGVEFTAENELVEWKQIVDRYLKTFEESAFEDIEAWLEEKSCGSDKKKKKKKESSEEEVKESTEETAEYECPKCGKKVRTLKAKGKEKCYKCGVDMKVKK